MTSNQLRRAFNFDDSGSSLDLCKGPYVPLARTAYRLRLATWILRIYGGYGDMPIYCEPGHPRMQAVADLVDVPAMADCARSGQEVQVAIAQALAACSAFDTDSNATPLPSDCAMRTTIVWLAQSAGLNAVEQDIYELAVALRVFGPLRTAFSHWGDVSQAELTYAMSAVINRPIEAVMQACMADAALFSSGLIRNHHHSEDSLESLLSVSRSMAQRIAFNAASPADILSHLAVPMKPPGLTLKDFKHIQQHTDLAQCWLSGALHATQERTANVAATEDGNSGTGVKGAGGHLLVSGEPGLGKTEWVRALLAHAHVNAMELVVLEANGKALSGEERLSHLRLLLRLYRGSPRGVIVFDEADDIFRQPSLLGTDGSDDAAVSMVNHRASLNKLLEDSPIPVVWIMNHPEVLDPAVLRRFDAVVHFEGIPRSVRMELLKDRFDQASDELQAWAQLPTLTPALIERLAVLQERAKTAGTPMDQALSRHWLRQRIPGKETRHLRQKSASGFEQIPWSVQSVNASVDLLGMVEGIRQTNAARILLHGLPGTGKTAYAHALARMLDKTLLEQRASDLLSAYVGETEQRISQCFDIAADDDAVLFIDEVDGLLARRDHAVRNWEVAQVNELLEQLGEFEGIVVLATNRLEALDPAVLRRMDIKIRFDPLNSEQIRHSFAQICLALKLSCTDDDIQAASTLFGLTPGDFACVARRMAFASLSQRDLFTGPDTSVAKQILQLLAEELGFKAPNKQEIGFVQQGRSSKS